MNERFGADVFPDEEVAVAPADSPAGPPAEGSRGDGQPPEAPEDTSPPSGERDREQNAEAAAGAKYAEQHRAAVTNVYVIGSRSYGVYAERDIKARDVTGRDQNAAGAEARREGKQPERTVSVVTVSVRDRKRLSRVAVSTDQHERACAILEQERFVILFGPPGTGKATAGLSLLGFEHDVLSVDPSLTARDLANFRQRFPYGPRRRYLIEGLPSATAAQLSRFVIRKLLQHLGSRQSYLVMTVDDRLPLSKELAGYVVPWPEPPDIALALRRHLCFYLPAEEVAAVEDRLDLPQLCAGIAHRGLSSLDDVARSVAAAHTTSRPFDSLPDELGIGVADRVARWFDDERGLADLGLLLAITVLGGCPYSTVAQHAQRLEALLAKGSRISLTGRPLDPLLSRSKRVRDSMAVLEPGFVDTEYGPSPAQTVRLETRWHVQAVLNIVWREYEIAAEVLITWLREAGDDPDPGVRLRAAAAAGWLSQHEFTTLRRRLFIPWARGSSRAAWAAADALGQAAWLDQAAPLALGLLGVWAAQETDYDLWWTAAVAFGGEVGVRHLAVAMDHLLMIAGRDDDRATPVVSHSVVRLASSGGRFAPEVAVFVLTHLAGWLDVGPAAARTAQQAYAELLRRASDPDWPSTASYWQLLTAPRSQEPSAILLRKVLGNQMLFRAEVRDSIEFLVRAGDQDPSVREQMAAMLTRVASAPGSKDIDRERLAHYLGRWAEGPDPSAAARIIADQLKEAPAL